jgi:hypothetical protein
MPLSKGEILKSKDAKRESKSLDFKAQFDTKSEQDWCEIIKDLVAIANSGGGLILVGVMDDGRPSGANVSEVLKLDGAKIGDKIRRYTGEEFDDFEVEEIRRNGKPVAAIRIGPADVPLVFIAQGSYTAGGKPCHAFAKGTVYFRHGAKSEPATRSDLRRVIEREVKRSRKELTRNLRQVTDAPFGSTVQVLSKGVSESVSPDAVRIRLTDDPSAPAYRKLDVDKDYPHRQKEVLAEVNSKLGKAVINQYDIQCVRNVFAIDKNERFCHLFKFSGRQYSDAFVDWLVQQYKADSAFFAKARAKHREQPKD